MSFATHTLLSVALIFNLISPTSVPIEQNTQQKCCFDPILALPQFELLKPLEPLTIEPIAEIAPITHIPKHDNVVPGNDYAPGNCTWYVKSKRPDLPNNLWHAKYWYENAQAAGYQTSDMPLIGAVGVSFDGYYGHVVYVEALNPDGTIMISEMNYAGEYSQRTRVASPSEFKYIY